MISHSLVYNAKVVLAKIVKGGDCWIFRHVLVAFC